MLVSFDLAVIDYRVGSSRYLIFELWEARYSLPGVLRVRKRSEMSPSRHTQLREHIIITPHHHISNMQQGIIIRSSTQRHYSLES
jgi:hypothetical protein